MDKNEILKKAVETAAIGFSEKLARHANLAIIQCSALEAGIVVLCKGLIDNGLVDTEELFDFLIARSYRPYDEIQDEWWKKK